MLVCQRPTRLFDEAVEYTGMPLLPLVLMLEHMLEVIAGSQLKLQLDGEPPRVTALPQIGGAIPSRIAGD